MAKEHKSLGRGLGSIIAGGFKKPAAPAAATKAPKAEAKAAAKPEPKTAPEQKPAQTPMGLFSEILIDKIALSPYQARKEFSEDEIAQLADSIASEGLLQPIIVRKLASGGYELIAGERRLRACKKLALKRISACVQTASNASSAVKGLIENLQRSGLNPMEEAQGIASLIANFKLTQESAAARLGKPRSSVANSLRLLTLPKEVQGFIAKGLLSQGHAKVLLSLSEKAQQTLLARKIIDGHLNVRMAEEAVKRIKNERERKTPGTSGSKAAQSAVVRDVQKKISERLNAAVELKHTPKRGKIIIEYFGNDDLQRILELLGVDI
ncbi:MAG: ParB/RepB/Spo0J family partition protein [Opitutales bacterium]|nr:ParB/RepB/Spo0J family partition protein [Opitutales bacterium]